MKEGCFMKKRMGPALVVYGVLLVIAAACILYYRLVGAQQAAIYADYTLYRMNLFCMYPLLYGSLAALIAELLQRADILCLPRGAKGVCLVLAALLIVLYAALTILSLTGTVALARYTLWLANWPQIFLAPGFLAGLGLYRNARA